MTPDQNNTTSDSTSEMNPLRPDRVLSRRAKICYWVGLGFAIVAAVFFGLVSKLGNMAVALGALSLALAIVPLLIGVVFQFHSRCAARLIAGEGLLAVWTCTPEEWALFAGKKRKLLKMGPQPAWIGRQGVVFRATYYAWTPQRIERFTINTKSSPALLLVTIRAHGFVRAMAVLSLLSASNQSLYAADTSAACKIPIPAAAHEQALALAVELGVKPVML